MNYDAFIPFTVERIDDATNAPVALVSVTKEAVKNMVLSDANLRQQIEHVSAEIAYWGNVVAEAQRTWEWYERQYRIWRDQIVDVMLTNTGEKGWKAPTGKAIEAKYRIHKQYPAYYAAIERAELAHGRAKAIYDGFKAQARILDVAVRRSYDNSAPVLGV